MKKVLLTSAAVLAVFASSAAVFANDGNVHTGNLDNKTEATGSDFFTNNEGGLTQAAKDGLNNVDADSTKQKFEDAGEHIEPKRDANGNIIKDGFVVTPQMTPMSFAFLISSTFAVSIKNFIPVSSLHI